MSAEPIDLHHQAPGIVASYLLETDDGPALFDCGPTTCVPALKAGLAERGLDLTDVRHLLLSHIHLDHAGAAGVLVRENPWLQVHVSEVGAPHLVDPSKLEASARRLYGDAFDALWGELAPVPEANVHVVGERVVGLDCFPTPGHAWHHVSYLDADGTLYAGDAAGVRIDGGSFVVPPCPPPELDLEAWERTIEEIERRAPGTARAHPLRRRSTTSRSTSPTCARRSAAGASASRTGWTRRPSSPPPATTSRRSIPSSSTTTTAPAPYWHHFRGLERYWRKRRGGRGLDLEGVRLEVGERDELERRGVRRLEHDRRRDARLERLLPARGDDAPAVARAEPREQPLRLRRHEVVPADTENSRNSSVIDRADGVEAGVGALGAAVAVAEEAGHRVEGARLELAAEDVHAEPTPSP